MAETLNLLIRSCGDGTYEVEVKESWSGQTACGKFTPPYNNRQIHALQKKLGTLESSDAELREVGHRLFSALCGTDSADTNPPSISTTRSVRTVLQGVIQRTLKRRGTVALTVAFSPGCEDFIRYPWELLHNGNHFLLVSGVFTLSRALLRPDTPIGCELPVHPPFRVLYIGASPVDCTPLETERSFEAMEQALTPLIDAGQVLLDRLEPPTFNQLVRYLNSYGGAGVLDDSDTTLPCYIIHFDGHGAYGRLCPKEDCETINDPEARKCSQCAASLSKVTPQTYLCFCDEEGMNCFIDTQSLRELLLSSDVRLAVFSACETATMSHDHHSQRRSAVDATLATALVTAQVPAVVAMPFSLQDDLSPTFMYHFYEALADGRMLEEALSRARQAMLPMQQKSWFIPVLYRHISERDEGPVPFLVPSDAVDEHAHPLAHLGPASSFVGREQELNDLDSLLTAAASGPQGIEVSGGRRRARPFYHHLALTGSPGIGKSAIACEAVRRNRDKFQGGIIGISLQEGKSFSDALIEIIQYLQIPARNVAATDIKHRERLIQGTLRSLASRELPCLLLLDSFEEVKDRVELETWLHFLCSLPQEVTVIVTSRSNPEHMMVVEGSHCRWYEYHVGNMRDTDLLSLFTELAASSGLDQRIQLDDPRQQAILREICTLLDGYPLGAELIFGTARSIGGQVYTPEAATRSLEEVRDELRSTPLAGILAVLEVSYHRLTPPAQLLLSYLSAFKLPFSREQIAMLISPDQPPVLSSTLEEGTDRTALINKWRAARDELVEASFIQFDGRYYAIHPQTRHFALSRLPLEERRRVHRLVAAYYYNLPHPSADEWFEAIEHLEAAGEHHDLAEAVHIAIKASLALEGCGYAHSLQPILRRVVIYARRLNDQTGEGRALCRLGTILRQLGQMAEAEACLKRSLALHQQLQEQEYAAWALYELAMGCSGNGAYEQALTYAQDALQSFQSCGSSVGEAWVYNVMGITERFKLNYHQALAHFEQALSIFAVEESQAGHATTVCYRGSVYAALGQYTKASHDYEDALRLFYELKRLVDQAWVNMYKSRLHVQQMHFDLAEKIAHEALDCFREQQIRLGEAWVVRTLGDIYYQKQDWNNARDYYNESVTLFGAVSDFVDQANVFNALGSTAYQEGEYLDAKDFYEQARAIALEYDAQLVLGLAFVGLAEIAFVLRQLKLAESNYWQAERIFAALNTPNEHARTLYQLGYVYESSQKYREALDVWVQALSLKKYLGDNIQADLQIKIDQLVTTQHLEDIYQQSRVRCGLAN